MTTPRTLLHSQAGSRSRRLRILSSGGLATLVLVLLGAVGPALPARAAAERWVWPLSPRPDVVRAFDPPADPWGAGHRGVDLAAVQGQRVRSASAGIVTYAGLLAGRGVVTVTHGTLRTTYEPVSASVPVGTRVAAGAPLGTVTGPRGGHCAPRTCLHWGLVQGSRYLDPLSLVGGGPPRLLPLGGTAPGSAGGIGVPLAGGGAGGSAPPRDTSSGGPAPLHRRSGPAVETAASQRGTERDNSPEPDRAAGATAGGGAAPGLSAAFTHLAAPAAGALAGAAAAAVVVRLSNRSRGRPASDRPPPKGPRGRSDPPRFARSRVVDLEAVRSRPRSAA